MNVEDSYEGAVRRLSRLGHAGVDLAPRNDRLHDLEELATLACDENDRLTRELDTARADIARLQHQVATLQETLMSAQPDDAFAAPKPRGRGAAFYFFTITIVGAGAAALFMFRPWERPLIAPAAVAVPAPVVQPIVPVVVAAPPPPIAPKVEPTIPKVAPVVVAPARTIAPVKTKSHHRSHAAKHHKHGAAAHSSNKPAVSDTDDPLGGVNL